ncbi:MAG: protease complex subunit PrcB family protein [Planctomycetes bacterium]|nr:protease complex subunit PrcB family protein [Planctomycetota bacterium]
MKRMVAVTFFVLVLTPLAGCKETWEQLENGTTGKYENSQDAYVLVKDATAWSFLYSWCHSGVGANPLPSVDFDQDVVGAVFLGSRPSSGYAVGFVAVGFAGPNVTAYVSETAPAPGSVVLWVITKPYAFARWTKRPGTVSFRKDWGLPVVVTEKTFAQLITEEYNARKAAYEAGGIPWPSAPEGQTASLNADTCPLDGTTLVTATLPASGSYVDVANEGHYCPTDGKYWVLHTQGAFVGTISYWWGPFTPGDYGVPAP